MPSPESYVFLSNDISFPLILSISTSSSSSTANGSSKSSCSSTSAQKPKKKKTRTTFTAYQLEELERAFERAPYPGMNR